MSIWLSLWSQSVSNEVSALSTKTSDYTLDNYDQVILADATSNTVDISLSPAPKQKQLCMIKCINATFACNILGNGNNMEGAAIAIPLALNQSKILIYDSAFGWGEF